MLLLQMLKLPQHISASFSVRASLRLVSPPPAALPPRLPSLLLLLSFRAQDTPTAVPLGLGQHPEHQVKLLKEFSSAVRRDMSFCRIMPICTHCCIISTRENNTHSGNRWGGVAGQGVESLVGTKSGKRAL